MSYPETRRRYGNVVHIDLRQAPAEALFRRRNGDVPASCHARQPATHYLGTFVGERKQRSRGYYGWQSPAQQLASLGVVIAGLIVLAFVVGAL